MNGEPTQHDLDELYRTDPPVFRIPEIVEDELLYGTDRLDDKHITFAGEFIDNDFTNSALVYGSQNWERAYPRRMLDNSALLDAAEYQAIINRYCYEFFKHRAWL